jgi:hypothetical protein
MISDEKIQMAKAIPIFLKVSVSHHALHKKDKDAVLAPGEFGQRCRRTE